LGIEISGRFGDADFEGIWGLGGLALRAEG